MGEGLFELSELYKKKFLSLQEYELIEKIIPSKNELLQISQQLKSFLSMSYAFNVLQEREEIISIFLVGCAKYYYNDGEGGFWNAVKNLIGLETISQKDKLIDIFDKTLRDYKLNTFDELKLEGYRKLAPVIAHSGLPINLSKNLFDGLSILASQNISYNDLGEETLFYCTRYMAPNVQRYLKVLNSNGLLNDYVSEIFEFINKNGTTIDDSLNIPVTLQQELIKWLQDKGPIDFTAQKGFSRPKLKYDINSGNIVLETPMLLLNNYSQLVWEVDTGQDVLIKKRIYSEEQNGTNRFRGTSFIINNIGFLKVKLLDVQGNSIYSMIIKESEEYLTFNNFGRLNKTKFILNNGAFILIGNQYSPVDNLDFVKTVGSCNLYYQQATSAKEEICFINEDGKTIDIKIKRPFELDCCSKVIGDNCVFDGINAYQEIPKILVPFNGEWKITITINDDIKTANALTNNYSINLSEVFENIKYGKVLLRLYNDVVGYKTFKFLYLPNIEVQGKYFPSINGYDYATVIKFGNNKDYYICNESHVKCDKLSVDNSSDIKRLYYNFYGKEYEFTLIVKPFSWRIEADGELIGQVNRQAYLSTKYISKNNSTILFVQNNYSSDLYITLNTGNVDATKGLIVKKNTERLISLKQYYEQFISAPAQTDVFIEVNNIKVCKICEIKPNLTIANFSIIKSNGRCSLIWDEDGACTNRELKMRDLYKPFECGTIPIQDKTMFLTMDMSNLTSNYICEVVQKEATSNMFFINREKKDKVIDPSNAEVLCVFDQKSFDNCFNIKDFDTIEKLIYSYLTYKYFTKAIKDKKTREYVLGELLLKIKQQRLLVGDEKIIEYLYNFDLSKEQFNDVAKEIGLFFPIFRYGVKFSLQIYDYLKKINLCLYFISALIKRDADQCIKILDFGKMTMINMLKDTDNYRWAKKYLLFPEIDDVVELKNEYQILKNQFPYETTPEEIYLYIIINKMFYGDICENDDEIKVITKLSNYICNLYDKYPHKFIFELFKQSSNQKIKGEIECR